MWLSGTPIDLRGSQDTIRTNQSKPMTCKVSTRENERNSNRTTRAAFVVAPCILARPPEHLCFFTMSLRHRRLRQVKRSSSARLPICATTLHGPLPASICCWTMRSSKGRGEHNPFHLYLQTSACLHIRDIVASFTACCRVFTVLVRGGSSATKP